MRGHHDPVGTAAPAGVPHAPRECPQLGRQGRTSSLANVVAARCTTERVGRARQRAESRVTGGPPVIDRGAGDVARPAHLRSGTGAPTPPRRRDPGSLRQSRLRVPAHDAGSPCWRPKRTRCSRSAAPASSVVMGAPSRPHDRGPPPSIRARIGPPNTSYSASAAASRNAASQPGSASMSSSTNTTSSPDDAAMPALRAAFRPRRWGSVIRPAPWSRATPALVVSCPSRTTRTSDPAARAWGMIEASVTVEVPRATAGRDQDRAAPGCHARIVPLGRRATAGGPGAAR